MTESLTNQTKRMAESHGCEVRDCGGGHIQIMANGKTVNYYPQSRRKTAYCNETGERETACTPYNAVAMVMRGKSDGPPKPKGHKNPRRHGPKPDDIKPKRTNPAGIRHLYDGVPWGHGDGFRFLANSDRLRYEAWRQENEVIAMYAHADKLDEETPHA